MLTEREAFLIDTALEAHGRLMEKRAKGKGMGTAMGIAALLGLPAIVGAASSKKTKDGKGRRHTGLGAAAGMAGAVPGSIAGGAVAALPEYARAAKEVAPDAIRRGPRVASRAVKGMSGKKLLAGLVLGGLLGAGAAGKGATSASTALVDARKREKRSYREYGSSLVAREGHARRSRLNPKWNLASDVNKGAPGTPPLTARATGGGREPLRESEGAISAHALRRAPRESALSKLRHEEGKLDRFKRGWATGTRHGSYPSWKRDALESAQRGYDVDRNTSTAPKSAPKPAPVASPTGGATPTKVMDAAGKAFGKKSAAGETPAPTVNKMRARYSAGTLLGATGVKPRGVIDKSLRRAGIDSFNRGDSKTYNKAEEARWGIRDAADTSKGSITGRSGIGGDPIIPPKPKDAK